ncbi:(2Fe-2S)-binding protein [Streptomyces sp. NPDC058287]|uniref:(2Fe-2S)-binding protein n=2 Tax=Streptomyces TaxID=1883 RepID=UPI0036E1F167
MSSATDQQLVSLTVNGESRELVLDPRRTLADTLRHELGLTGTHLACEHGICGACTVLVDGRPARSCLMFAVQAEGRQVCTVESLGEGGQLGDLQQSFADHHGLQCGFCTPGFLMLAEGFLAQNPDADREEIREAVSSNLCRCTGYQTIVDAVEHCATARRTQRAGRLPHEGNAQ